MRKRGLFLSIFVFIFSFFVIVFLSGMGSALPYYNSCSGSDIIFRLSAEDNAHGADFECGQSNLPAVRQLGANCAVYYPVTVCASQFFTGTTPTSGSVTRNGAGTIGNEPFRLSDYYNAHGSLADNNYPVLAYYGGNFGGTNYRSIFNCNLLSSCSPGSVAITSFSDSSGSNAHFGDPSKYSLKLCCTCTAPGCGLIGAGQCGNGVINVGETCDGGSQTCLAGGYPGTQTCNGGCNGWNPCGTSLFCGDNICNGPETSASCSLDCAAPVNPVSASDVVWKDIFGSNIADVNVNSTAVIHANVNYQSSWDNEQILVYIEVYEKDPSADDLIASYVEDIRFYQSDSNVLMNHNFLINDSLAHNDDIFGFSFQEEIYYRLRIPYGAPGSGIPDYTINSNVINVLDIPGPNSPPIANISAPVDRGIYFQGTSVLFNQSSFDPNGPNGLIYKWTIDEDNYQDAKHNFTYTFSSAGQKTVTLRVTDPQGDWDEQQVSILVLPSEGALAYIDAPRHREVVPATLIPGQSGTRLNVSYNGTGSFVVNSVPGSPCPSVSCLAGLCPGQTQNLPGGCNTGNSPGNRPNLTLTGVGSNPTFTNTNFTWKFSDGFTIVNRTGVENAVGNKIFGSSYAGEARINLSVQYADAGVFAVSSGQRIFNLGQCVNNGNNWIVKDANGKETDRLITTGATNGCLGGDGQNGTSDDCCPNGWGCLKDGGDSDYRCRQLVNLNTTDICSQQTSQGSCLNVSRNILITDPLWGVNRCDEINSTTGNLIECGCSWTSNNKCIFNSSSLNNVGGITWSCISSYSQGECVNGYMTLDITNTFFPGTSGLNSTQAGCDDERRQVLCGRPVVELPFFGNNQLIVAVLLIVGIYLVLSLRHKRRR